MEEDSDVDDLANALDDFIIADNPEALNSNDFVIDFSRLTKRTFALRVLDMIGSDAVLFTGGKVLYFYNGIYWESKNVDGLGFLLPLFPSIFDFYKEALDSISERINSRTYFQFYNVLLKLDDPDYRRAVVKAVRDEVFRQETLISWNSDNHLLAFEDDIFNSLLDTFVSPSPEQFINISTGYRLRESTFEQQELDVAKQLLRDFFLDICCGDASLCDFLWMSISTFLEKGNKEQFIYFWLGDGRNGKTTLMELISFTFGAYFGTLSKEYYTKQPKRANEHQQQLVDVR